MLRRCASFLSMTLTRSERRSRRHCCSVIVLKLSVLACFSSLSIDLRRCISFLSDEISSCISSACRRLRKLAANSSSFFLRKRRTNHKMMHARAKDRMERRMVRLVKKTLSASSASSFMADRTTSWWGELLRRRYMWRFSWAMMFCKEGSPLSTTLVSARSSCAQA